MMQRIRIKYEKGDSLKYTGNLDMHKVWERIFRRAQLPLAYSQGFHPQPRIQQACPLPLGFTSVSEELDFWLDSDNTEDQIRAQIIPALQPGIKIISLESIDLKLPALQSVIRSSTYIVNLEEVENKADLGQNISHLLESESVLRERRGKKYDLRPLIKSLSVENDSPNHLIMTLSVMAGATGRPEEVLEELGIPPLSVDIERINLSLE